MIDKQAGILEIDVLSREKRIITSDVKSKGRKIQTEGTSHLEFINYLKSTCRQRNEVLFHKQMAYKQLAQPDHQSHQHLILTMRTQYEARPNS